MKKEKEEGEGKGRKIRGKVEGEVKHTSSWPWGEVPVWRLLPQFLVVHQYD